MKLLLTILGVYFTIQLSAREVADSSKHEQNKSKELLSIISKVGQLRDSSYNASIRLGKQAVLLAENTQNHELVSKSYMALAKTYHYKGTFDSAMYYYNKAIGQFRILKDSLNIGKATGNMGVIYRRKGKYDLALKQYLEAMKMYKAAGYQKGINGLSLNIGGVYHKLQEIEKALHYYLEAKKAFQKSGNKDRTSRALMNIGVIKYEQGKFREALQCQLQSLKLSKEAGMIQHRATILLNLGQVYEALNELEKSLDYYTQCEELRLKLNDTWGLGKIYTFKAIVYNNLNRDAEAETYFRKAEKSNVKNNLSEDLSVTYLYYSNFWEKKNNYLEAHKYYKKYSQISDSLAGIYQKESIAGLIAKYESEQNAKELELLQQRTKIQKLELGQKNAWIITLLVILILGIVAVLVSLRINRLRADHKILDLRQKVLLTQMNPHFLFNSLTAIQSFILDERNDDANSYLSRLASLVRGILENSREEFVTIRTELQTLEDYIMMQKLRFDNDISYKFHVDSEIDMDKVMIPPMLAQPFIENALIHGRLRNNPEAEIAVNVSIEKNDLLQFEILDNGIGVDEARKQMHEKNHKSLATSIALDRVKIYNFKSSKKMNFEITDLRHLDSKLHGTKVSYSIPIQVCSN